MIISVSLPDKLYQWAQEKEISLSKKLQESLLSMQEDTEAKKKNEITATAETKLAIMSDRFNNVLRFVEEKGLTNELLAKKRN